MRPFSLIRWRIITGYEYLGVSLKVHGVYALACGVMIYCSGFSLEKELKECQRFSGTSGKIIVQGIKSIPWLLMSTKEYQEMRNEVLVVRGGERGEGAMPYHKLRITHPSSEVKIFR